MINTLILRRTVDIFLTKYDIVNSCINVNTSNFIYRLFRKLKIPKSIFFASWKKKIKKYKKVIIFDNTYDEYLTKYIKKKNPQIKIILWYWNSMVEYNNENIAKDDSYIDEIWTYNRFDAKDYGLKYNPQFYSKKIKSVNTNIQNDIIFMGRDKGRKEELINLKDSFNGLNLQTEFIIIEKEKDLITYDSYIEKVLKSKCILDYGNFESCGLSLRPLEALFLKKKLITNNKDIINYDFYNNNNIFVLGLDNIAKLNDFINSEYIEIDQKIVDYYDFDNWLKRFDD